MKHAAGRQYFRIYIIYFDIIVIHTSMMTSSTRHTLLNGMHGWRAGRRGRSVTRGALMCSKKEVSAIVLPATTCAVSQFELFSLASLLDSSWAALSGTCLHSCLSSFCMWLRENGAVGVKAATELCLFWPLHLFPRETIHISVFACMCAGSFMIEYCLKNNPLYCK